MAALATTASAASESPAYRVRIRWVPYPSAREFVDPVEVSVSPESTLTVLRERRVNEALVRPRERELAEDRLVVQACDAEGKVRFESVIPDPRVLRAEQASPEGRLAGRLLHRSRVEFDVVVPDDPAIVLLRLYHPRWTGDDWALEPVGTVSLRTSSGDAVPPPPPPPAAAAPIATIVDNGDPARRVDLAILGDGYTSAELGKYAGKVAFLVESLLSEDPFSEYRKYFNVHRVDVVSAQSGADHPSLGTFVDTALGARFDCNKMERLLCVDQSAVNAVVGDSLSKAQADLVLVLVNDDAFGGSGGVIAVASTGPDLVELALHEAAGHSFGSLADEYGGSPSCGDGIEPSEPNVTRQARVASAKWKLWIDPSSPTRPACEPGVPTLCEGARYCDSGLYRATYQSKMRTLGSPFDQINREQLVKRIYNLVSPIDSASPVSESLTLKPGQKRLFKVTTPRPSTHSLKVTWTVDGEPRATTAQFTLVAPPTAGSHKVTVSVEDPTPMVRNDPKGLLKESRSWTVIVTATP